MRFWSSLILTIVCVSCASSAGLPSITNKVQTVATRQFAVHQELSLINEGENQPDRQNIWIALIHDIPPYQSVLSRTVSPEVYTLFSDEYGNQYAEFDLSDHPAGTTITMNIDYVVVINELVYDLEPCEGELPQDFTQPELHIESANPQIVALSEKLREDKDTACQQVRAYYDYAGDELVYTFNRHNWGAQAALGQMGADCTEYASLVIALSRAGRIPARYYEGLLYLKGSEKDTQIAQTEHAWLDVYLPGIGWAAMDPTLGRSPAYRDTYFAHYTANHIIVTTGRNPSTLRGVSYWSHLYWPGNSTIIRVQNAHWTITPLDN